jgi:cytochrome b6-f complex iron-sulfur subunit
MADPNVKDRAVQQWPSPWPYDFPVEGKVPSAPDKVARVSGTTAEAPKLTLTRRNLFSSALLGWGAFATAGGVGTLGLVRFLFPNVSFEPPQIFKCAPLGKFSKDSVDETWKETNAVWIVNTEGYLYAISTVCTHLGCTPNWLESESKFKCPCHGSGYYRNGVNFEGPTPRPLERFRIYVDPADGNVWVDKTMKCQVELATCDAANFRLAVSA